jgi:predicted HTH domain antitoxin
VRSTRFLDSNKENDIINVNLEKRGDSMGISVNLPEMNIKEDEVKLLLAMKLLEEGIVSLGKAAEIAGYSEKAFVEILFHKGIPPIKYSKLDLEKELQHA